MLGQLSSTLKHWSDTLSEVEFRYCKVASSNTSRLEAHAGIVISFDLSPHCCVLGQLSSTLKHWSETLSEVEFRYLKVACSNTSLLEAHAGIVISFDYSHHCCVLGQLSSTLKHWSETLSEVEFRYLKVACSNTSLLEAHAGIVISFDYSHHCCVLGQLSSTLKHWRETLF